MSTRFIFIVILLLNCNYLLISNASRRFRRVTQTDQKELEKAHRNAECCAKKMRCCVKLHPPPIELRAVLTRCPNLGVRQGSLTRTMNAPVAPSSENNIKGFQGFDEDEPLVESRVTDCRSKVVMTLKLHHKGNIVCKSQYIVVDHVYDPVTDKSVRLLNPYVIRLKQEPVSKSFHLKFVDYANSEAHEEVHNKQEANYTGCYTSKFRTTCGRVKYNGKVIPYSEGFCCSCDPKKNQQRQPEGQSERNENQEVVSYSDPAYLMERISCPKTYFSSSEDQDQLVDGTRVINIPSSTTTEEPQNRSVRINFGLYKNNMPSDTRQGEAPYLGPKKYTKYSDRKLHRMHITSTYRPAYLKREVRRVPAEGREPDDYLKTISTVAIKKNNQSGYMNSVIRTHVEPPYMNPLEESRYLFIQNLARKMRQTFPSGVQKRGGQNCADRFTPNGLDPDHYHESAHCLRFSDVWYGIYKLGKPNIEQVVYVNIYERFEAQGRTDKWREITNGTIRMGNRYSHYEDELPAVSVDYRGKSLSDPEQYSNWDTKRILIPEGVDECDKHKYPEMRGGPEEYLVVGSSRIAIEGDQCDTVGVGFEAFFNQPQRCGAPRGTCLHNQPKQLWRNDKILEHKNKRGCFFLKYHANITHDPMFINETTGAKYLFVDYHGAHVAVIDMEIKADRNAVIRDVANAAVTEVYVDSTCNKYTFVTIKVINTGLISSKFMVQLSDFPPELPESFTKIRSKMAVIAPQTMHIFNLQIKTPLPSDLMYCSAEVLNKKEELVALRRVRIQKFDRCICAWYCLCACVASLTGLKCQPMSLEHYHAAGFEGALPIVTYMVHFTLLDDLLSVAFYFILFLLGMLLLMGFLKAFLGLCNQSIGLWGLPVILDLPKPLAKYHERKLRDVPVEYDQNGWPLHPQTFNRARSLSIIAQFSWNVVFFFTYPLICTIVIMRRLCCPYYTSRTCRGAPEKKKSSCMSCCKSCKKKKKKDHPCGNPQCDANLCLMNKQKNKKVKKAKKSGSDTPRGKKKSEGPSKFSSQSSKSSKKKPSKLVAAFTFDESMSPFQQAARKSPRESYPFNLENLHQDDHELSSSSEGSSIFSQLGKSLSQKALFAPKASNNVFPEPEKKPQPDTPDTFFIQECKFTVSESETRSETAAIILPAVKSMHRKSRDGTPRTILGIPVDVIDLRERSESIGPDHEGAEFSVADASQSQSSLGMSSTLETPSGTNDDSETILTGMSLVTDSVQPEIEDANVNVVISKVSVRARPKSL